VVQCDAGIHRHGAQNTVPGISPNFTSLYNIVIRFTAVYCTLYYTGAPLIAPME
jgi:hypothetical protein